MKTMKDDIQSVLYTEEQLREGVKELQLKSIVIMLEKKFMLLVF